MSGDEITFGEMSLREPERRPRPDRDRKYACLAYEVPGPADLPIFLDRNAADAIERHALTDTSVELGGILLGKECLDPATGQPFVWITQSLEAKHYANTQASFTYTHDSWADISRERDRQYPQYDIVGWYHTHPSFGIFLSHHDLFIHQHFFAQPLQVAYVVDPINQTRGFFQWRDGGMAQVAGYHLSAKRTDRVALARLVNDLEKLPNPEGNSGGTLSPRLEAELINMLTRPAQRDVTQPIERFQIAAVFGLLGTFLGVLGVAAALWLNQLQGRIHEQNESIQALARLVEKSTAGQRLVSDTLLERAGGGNPAEFTTRYELAVTDRDDALRRLGIQHTMNEDLGARYKDLETRAGALATDLETAQKSLAQSEKDAQDVPKLRERIASLVETNEQQQKKLDDLQPWLESTDGQKAVQIQHDLVNTRYVAIAGGFFTVLLALALVALFFYQKPSAEAAPIVVERPPHQII
ncbi:MAG: Mov34/MPN/PAD-1 family protein [Isosphaerales bacterium]